ncbi:MAG: T9SS type A sorting domain-containing protein [Crocinitomicaceae bacterium]|nr:T9SS type A sorting domain-containing protein [Crocinitomicaceae bacterium]
METFSIFPLQESTDEIFRIYPNPALDQITIPENLSLFSIYSLSGKLIYIFENPDPVISISELNKGVYLIKAIDKDNNQFQQKLIVE